MNQKNIGTLLLVAALAVGYMGFEKGKPTKLESFGKGLGSISQQLNQSVSNTTQANQAQQGVDNIKAIARKRAMPFYIGAGLLGLAGIIVLVREKA